MTVYEKRRAEFLTRVVADAGTENVVAIIPSATTSLRNADTEYEFRQNSDFFYLTGVREPDAVAVLSPARTSERYTLFIRPRDRMMEIWNGKRSGIEGALAEHRADAAYPIDEFERRLPDLLVGAGRLFYRLGQSERFDRRIVEAVGEARYRVRRGGTAPEIFADPGTALHEMRLFKEAGEIETMRRAGAITRLGHVAGMRATRPGLTEYELEAIIEFAYRTNGAQDVAYTSIVAGGDNATILHYNTNRETLRDGTLVLVDSGAELDVYASDVTRTWPVNGRFTAEQRAIYEIVLAAQKAGIEEVRTGRTFNAYHEAAVRVITEGLIDLGLIEGSLEAALEKESFKDFYMHRTGHWLGLDVHDVGRYKTESDEFRDLAPGMVLTVEPGIYVQRDLACAERFKGIGVRIEDDVLCTAGEPDVLTAGIPKEIRELEDIVGSDALAAAR